MRVNCNLLSEEQFYFFLNVKPILEGVFTQRSKQEVTEVVLLCRNGGKATKMEVLLYKKDQLPQCHLSLGHLVSTPPVSQWNYPVR